MGLVRFAPTSRRQAESSRGGSGLDIVWIVINLWAYDDVWQLSFYVVPPWSHSPALLGVGLDLPSLKPIEISTASDSLGGFTRFGAFLGQRFLFATDSCRLFEFSPLLGGVGCRPLVGGRVLSGANDTKRLQRSVGGPPYLALFW